MPVCEREIFVYNIMAFASNNVCTSVTSGDLAFLIKLLENSNASFQNMFDVGRLLNIFECHEIEQQLGGANNDN